MTPAPNLSQFCPFFVGARIGLSLVCLLLPRCAMRRADPAVRRMPTAVPILVRPTVATHPHRLGAAGSGRAAGQGQ